MRDEDNTNGTESDGDQSRRRRDASKRLRGSAGACLPTGQVLVGDALAQLRRLPAGSINTVVTSPPYFMLRNYSVEGADRGGDVGRRVGRGAGGGHGRGRPAADANRLGLAEPE